MTKREEIVKRQEEFEKRIKEWIVLEDLTVGSCDAIAAKTESPIAKAIVMSIKMDSMKHKDLLGLVMQCLEGTVTMTPDELGTVSALLEDHAKLERKAISYAENCLEDSRHFVISHIIKYILDDERKHFAMSTDLNAYKSHMYPYA